MLVPKGNPYDLEEPDEYFHTYDDQAKLSIGNSIAARAESILGRHGSMLEIGCGPGAFLSAAAKRGWTVSGVEMTGSYAELARLKGIDVECATAETCAALNRTYDAILLPNILEHLYDPIFVLRRVRAALNVSGIIVIGVPNERSLVSRVGNLYQRLSRRDWVVNLSPTFPPFHVVGFTRRSLRYALETTGFEIIELTSQRWPNVFSSDTSIRSQIERTAVGVTQWLGWKLGMGDGFNCWARGH